MILLIWILALQQGPKPTIEVTGPASIRLEAEPGALSVPVGLVVRGGAIQNLALLPPWFTDGADTQVPGIAARLTDETGLTRDLPVRRTIEITGITRSGNYRGELVFVSADDPSISASIPLTLVVRSEPEIALRTKSVSLSLVNSDHWLSKWLLPESAFVDAWALHLENRSDRPLRLTAGDLLLEGNGLQPDRQQVSPPDPTVLEPGLGSLAMNIQRTRLEPGAYKGPLTLAFEGVSVEIPVVLEVRDGPFWLIVWLIIGIFGGQFVKYMTKDGGREQSDALGKVYRLEGRLEKLDNDDADLLRPLLLKLRQRVYDRKLDGLDKAFEDLEQRIDDLAALRAFAEQLEPKREHPTAADALSKIPAIRGAIGNGEDYRADLEALLSIEISGLMNKNAAPGSAFTADGTPEPERQPEPVPQSRWQRFRAWLDTPVIQAELTLWLGRPLLWLILLLVLIYLGIKTFYIEKGATFGADPLDYVGALLWGFSSDVVGRSITDLTRKQA